MDRNNSVIKRLWCNLAEIFLCKIVQARNTTRPHTYMDIGHEIISAVVLSSSAHSKKAIVNYCLVAKLPLHIQFDQ